MELWRVNTYWIACTAIAITLFAIGESYAFKHPDRQNTLSRAIYLLGKKWPLAIFLMGAFAGGLAVHFFWNWDPSCAPPGVGG